MNESIGQPSGQSGNKSPWTWKDVLLIAVVSGVVMVIGLIAIGLALVLIYGRRTSTGALATPFVSLAAGALEAVALTGSVYFLGLRRRHLDWSALGLRPVTHSWLFVALILGLFAIPLSSVVAVGVQELLGQPLQNPQEAFLLPQGLNLPTALAMIFFVGLAGPFAEEILFRGVLYNWLRGRWGFIPSALVSALLFGAVHVEPSVAAATFVLGLVIAAVYEASHSLWTAITIHAVNNTLVVLVLYLTVAMGIKP